jgi:hypothetical protein
MYGLQLNAEKVQDIISWWNFLEKKLFNWGVLWMNIWTTYNNKIN